MKSELNQAWTEREILEQNHAGSIPRSHWHQQEPFGSVQSSLMGHHCDCLEISQCLEFFASAVEVARRGSYLRITNTCQPAAVWFCWAAQTVASSNSHLKSRKPLWKLYLTSKHPSVCLQTSAAASSQEQLLPGPTWSNQWGLKAAWQSLSPTAPTVFGSKAASPQLNECCLHRMLPELQWKARK